MEPFGLVKEAPAYLGWVFFKEEWRAEAGGATRAEASRMLRARAGGSQGVILPRGQHPNECFTLKTAA